MLVSWVRGGGKGFALLNFLALSNWSFTGVVGERGKRRKKVFVFLLSFFFLFWRLAFGGWDKNH